MVRNLRAESDRMHVDLVSYFYNMGVLGIKVKIMLDWDPKGKQGPTTPLPDVVTIHHVKEDEEFNPSRVTVVPLPPPMDETNKAGHQDEPVHAAATRIQNKFHRYKGKKEFLILRQ